jgi:hypothetical protein
MSVERAVISGFIKQLLDWLASRIPAPQPEPVRVPVRVRR